MDAFTFKKELPFHRGPSFAPHRAHPYLWEDRFVGYEEWSRESKKWGNLSDTSLRIMPCRARLLILFFDCESRATARKSGIRSGKDFLNMTGAAVPVSNLVREHITGVNARKRAPNLRFRTAYFARDRVLASRCLRHLWSALGNL
jgi:hypothetical protein